jgi:hypothetical protein
VPATPAPPPSRRVPRDGGYSVLEAAITVPAAFLVLMLVVQAAIVWHARGVAEAAAQEGLRTAQAYQSTAAAGRLDTVRYLTQVAPRALSDPQVSVTRATKRVSVTVHARVISVIPFAHLAVTETASGPVETFVPAP